MLKFGFLFACIATTLAVSVSDVIFKSDAKVSDLNDVTLDGASLTCYNFNKTYNVGGPLIKTESSNCAACVLTITYQISTQAYCATNEEADKVCTNGRNGFVMSGNSKTKCCRFDRCNNRDDNDYSEEKSEEIQATGAPALLTSSLRCYDYSKTFATGSYTPRIQQDGCAVCVHVKDSASVKELCAHDSDVAALCPNGKSTTSVTNGITTRCCMTNLCNDDQSGDNKDNNNNHHNNNGASTVSATFMTIALIGTKLLME